MNDRTSRPDSSAVPHATPRWSVVGPGLVVAATGVGAADMVAALIAGQRYGLGLIWALLVGVVLKFALNEGVGRYTLATGNTIVEGIHSLGRVASGYFGTYTIIWGFIYGAAATSSCALAVSALLPGLLPFWVWAVIHGLAGCALVLANRYAGFERIMTWLIGVMFVAMIGSAALVLPDLRELMSSALPTMPSGSLIYVFGLIGGVGGTITMASYGYWLMEKGWSDRRAIRVMRLDSASAYLVTGLFCLAMLVMGTAILYGTELRVSGEVGLVSFADALGNRLQPWVRVLFLIGFWAAAFTSVIGVWNGVSYLWADFVRILRKRSVADTQLSSTGAYRFYVLWLTFPPMLLHLFDEPVMLVILYGALGAVFMPFLAAVLLILLNHKRIDPAYRSASWSNLLMLANLAIFAVLMVVQLWRSLSS